MFVEQVVGVVTKDMQGDVNSLYADSPAQAPPRMNI